MTLGVRWHVQCERFRAEAKPRLRWRGPGRSLRLLNQVAAVVDKRNYVAMHKSTH